MIPIYRAKKIDSDEWVNGYLIVDPDRGRNYYYIKKATYLKDIDIDPNTLAIHFPNMIDKKGKKIFASLSEDGVGGDIVNLINWNEGWDTYIEHELDEERIVLYENYSIIVKSFERDAFCSFEMVGLEECEVIGTHKGEG